MPGPARGGPARTPGHRKKPRRLPRKKTLEQDPERIKTTPRERTAKFVEAYKRTGDLILAATEARLSHGEAKVLVQSHPELREDVISLLNRLGATPERIVREMQRVAMSDPRQLVDDDGEPLPLHEWPEDFARAVSGMDIVKRTEYDGHGKPQATETTYKPRLWEKTGMLRELAKMQAIAGAETQRMGNMPGERMRMDDGGAETREQIMLTLLALVPHKKEPDEEKGK